MGLSLEESAKKIEEQVITLEKWEEERDRLIGAVRLAIKTVGSPIL